MATCFDVVQHNMCVSCKDVKKPGSLRFYMVSALLAMVQIFDALHSLWVTVLPFALLWWNVMLYATCAKYYSWNRSLLRLQTAGRRFCVNITLESDASFADERGKILFSPGSSADASHAENREMSIFSLLRQAACADAVKRDVVCIPLDRYGDVAAACPENSGPQFEERIACETTSLASKAQVLAASSHTSNLSSLCFQSQLSGVLQSGQWANCSFLLPHQVPSLAMLDVHLCPQIPLNYSCVQVYLHRNGNMLDLKVPMLIDHASINWPMLREWLQTFNGDYVPTVNCGEKHSDFACNSTKLLASQTRNDNYAILQFILSTTEGFNIFNTISSYDAVESLKLRIGGQWSSWDLLGFKMKRNIASADNEGSASDRSEDLGSASIKSDDGCDGMYCPAAESTIDRDDDSEDSGVVYGKQCYRDEYGYFCYNFYRSYEDSGFHSAEDAGDVHGSFAHRAMDKEDGFYDCSADCNEGYNGLHCVTDVEGFCGMDYDADDGDYNNFDGNVEGTSGAVCGDFHFPYADGVYENPLEMKQINVAKSNTWWDDDVVLVAKQETEEDSIEQEWQVV